MDIECQGCYYTVCSFVCLTEDLSEILQFLWRHGCLRKSYLCEKCGRKCAIGDKDLFFRCNRNLVDPSPDSDLLFQQSLPRGPVPPPPQLQYEQLFTVDCRVSQTVVASTYLGTYTYSGTPGNNIGNSKKYFFSSEFKIGDSFTRLSCHEVLRHKI